MQLAMGEDKEFIVGEVGGCGCLCVCGGVCVGGCGCVCVWVGVGVWVWVWVWVCGSVRSALRKQVCSPAALSAVVHVLARNHKVLPYNLQCSTSAMPGVCRPDMHNWHACYNCACVMCTSDRHALCHTERKPKHASFCMKGATTHTSLHQIGPNLASN